MLPFSFMDLAQIPVLVMGVQSAFGLVAKIILNNLEVMSIGKAQMVIR